jgi:hypothetical protein
VDEAQYLLNQLKQKPFIQVPFPIPKDQLVTAMEAFFDYLALPEDIKTHIDFRLHPKHRRGDVGFRHRDPEDGPYNDSKDFFHYYPGIESRYADFIAANPVVERFLKLAQPIWEAAYAICEKQLLLLDQLFPGAHQRVFAADEIHLCLRFLKYNWAESSKYLAKPHFDAGSFTLAIAESCSGLRIGKGPDDLTPVEHKEDHALFMVSSNFQKVLETDEIAPGWHDVIQLDETQIGKPFARWAIVAFLDAENVEALPRSETHKHYIPTEEVASVFADATTR